MRRLFVVFVLGLAANCGHAEFDVDNDSGLLGGDQPDQPPPATLPDTPTPIDTPPPPEMPKPTKACATWGAFAKPTKLTSVSTAGKDWRPQITIDGLTLYVSYQFIADGQEGAYIAQATRASTTSNFPTPQRANGLPSPLCDKNTEGGAQLSPDGTLLVYHCHVGGFNEIFVAPRKADGTFGTSQRLTNTPGVHEIYPAISADSLRLYYGSDNADDDGVGDLDVFLAQRTSATAAFPAATRVNTINTREGAEWMLVENRAGTEAFITKSGDIYRMTRDSISSAWRNPVRVAALNTPREDYPGSLSFDGSTLYLNHGDDDIWQAVRPCLDATE